VPREDITSVVRELRTIAFWSALALIFGLTLVGALVTHRLLKPLRQLHAAAQSMFEEKQSDAIQWPRGSGELGDLANALQRAARRRIAVEAKNLQMVKKLQSMMVASPVPVAFSRKRKFELVSPSFAALFERRAREMVGQPTAGIYVNQAAYDAIGPKVAAAFAQRQVFDGEIEAVSATGRTFWARLRGQPVDWSNQYGGTIWTVEDITQEREREHALTHAAMFDALTNIANRAQLEQRMREVMADPERRAKAALLMFDLDRFKRVNDEFGHQAGDAVLQAVARATRHCVRAQDLVGRLGGDEFVVILEAISPQVARDVADLIQKRIDGLIVPWLKTELRVGASVGISYFDQGFTTIGLWMRAADTACYDAKLKGGSTVMESASSRFLSHMASDPAATAAPQKLAAELGHPV
jgi:diguanylate cyclase (GGDEF)-like protein/PAS domain S-box-containing protein